VRKLIGIVGVVLFTVTFAVAPVGAATTNVNVSWNGQNGSFPGASPNSASIGPSDSITFEYDANAPVGSGVRVYSNGICDPNAGVVGDLNPGDTTTVTPGTSTTYSFFAVIFGTGTSSSCTSFTATVTQGSTTTTLGGSGPPPDVPEAPYTAGLLGAASVLLGGEFFVLRRRSARHAA